VDEVEGAGGWRWEPGEVLMAARERLSEFFVRMDGSDQVFRCSLLKSKHNSCCLNSYILQKLSLQRACNNIINRNVDAA
jgi:hypothetical protein